MVGDTDESTNTVKFYGDVKFSAANHMISSKTTARDDLISLFYLGVYLGQKDLPWSDFVDCMPC